ncbi:hypothetical protein B566_EDAN006824 [Ephemera danica]|nr:hypothetical protein B566_EDAN006824 [Ephemera danica]
MSGKKEEQPSTEDHTWVLDSLVQFLNGPVWNKPIAAFIEKKSIIFEPDTEEFTPDHYTVHGEYRNLVDSLLGGFVEELQISPSQFEKAVNNAGDTEDSSTLARFQPGALLEQIWAASDFTAFSQLMGLRNLELQLQALDSIRSRENMPFALQDPDTSTGNLVEEDRLLKHVLRRSMDDSTKVDRTKKIHRLSLTENRTNIASIADFGDKSGEKMKQKPVNEKKEKLATEENVQAPPQDSKTPTNYFTSASTELSPDEIKKRKEYLCQQRDKLLNAKGRGKTTRPVETKLNQLQLEEHDQTANTISTEESDQSMQLRRALVNRLKTEVIKKIIN